jgi:hypothetical protein
MAQIRSKQISDFLASVNWGTVSNTDIANAADVKDYVDSVVAAEEGRNDARLDGLDNSVDSLESALSAEIVATNADVDSIDLRLGEVSGDLVDSVDSLESALSAEISATNSDVTSLGLVDDSLESRISAEEVARGNGDSALNDLIVSLEEKHDREMGEHHTEHTSLIAAEESRAIVEEGKLADSVDSLESALSAEIFATNGDVTGINNSIDSLESALSAEIVATNSEVTSLDRLATDNYNSIALILDGSTVDLDQFSEVVSFVEAIDLANDNQFASYVLANDATNAAQNGSIDSLESGLSAEIVARGNGDAALNDLIVSLEEKHDREMGEHHTEHTSLIAAEESRAIVEEGKLADSVDSLESALSAEIFATNADVTSIDLAIADNATRDGWLADSVDSLESALSAEIVATNADVDSIDLRLGEVSGDLVDSVDSLESALSAEISATNADVASLELIDGSLEARLSTEEETRANDDSFLNDLIVSLEEKHNREMDEHHIEHTSLIAAEASTAREAEGFLADSVDSLESALSAEIAATNGDVNGINLSIDSLESALSAEIVATNSEVTSLDTLATQNKNSIALILDGSSVDLDQFSEVVSFVEAIDLANDNQFASYVLANDGINTAQNNSIDSLESALSAEIFATNGDVTGINLSIDSLESALSAEISATNADVVSIDAAITAEAGARVAGDTYVAESVTGAAGPANSDVPFNTLSSYEGGNFDLEVYVNGLRVDFTQLAAKDFTLNVNYDLEPTDIITVIGVKKA